MIIAYFYGSAPVAQGIEHFLRKKWSGVQVPSGAPSKKDHAAKASSYFLLTMIVYRV